MCPTELTAFSDRYAEFAALDTEILGVSVDSQYTHLAWINTPRKQVRNLGAEMADAAVEGSCLSMCAEERIGAGTPRPWTFACHSPWRRFRKASTP